MLRLKSRRYRAAVLRAWMPLVFLAACGPTPHAEPVPPEDCTPSACTFQQLERRVIAPSCTAGGCHSPPVPDEGLDLTAGNAHASLVNKPSVQVPTLLLVKPGDPDASYLVYKLEGRASAVGGQALPMPPPDSSISFDEQELALIRAWIEAGAPND